VRYFETHCQVVGDTDGLSLADSLSDIVTKERADDSVRECTLHGNKKGDVCDTVLDAGLVCASEGGFDDIDIGAVVLD
jgi:hypothetical protein